MENLFVDKDYLARCSEKTLQTNPKGFFLQFADHVADVAGENWIKNVFGKLKSDRERFRIIYNYKPVKEALFETLSHVQEVFRKKSAEVAYKRRMETEILLKREELSKALALSSQAVLRAPVTGENHKIDDGFTLALSHWNRASVLICMKKYALAIVDIQTAIKECLADELKPEAFCKMAICYKGLGEQNKADISFNLANRLAQGNQRLIKKVKEYQNYNEVEVQQKEIDRRVLPTVTSSKHPDFPNASNKISLNKEKDKGRYIIAKDAMKTGDVVVVEEPYAACLLPESFNTHCHHCFDRLEAPVGCLECSNIAFCKAECRNIASSTYHKYECHYLDLLIGSGMSILCHTALRMITQSPLKKTLDMYNNKSKEKIFEMCANSALRAPDELLQRTIMASFLLRCLQKSGYFEDGEGNEELSPTEEELCVGELLLFFLQILQFNAHEIYETQYKSDRKFDAAKTAYVGVAIYPTASLFNHDCYPAVTRHFVGKNIVITAVRPLNPGETISENYGPIFTRRPLAARQRSLSSRYWFNCQCQACLQDWPGYDNGLESATQRLNCPTINCSNVFTLPITKETLKCPKCNKKVCMKDYIMEISHIEKEYEEANKLAENNNTKDAISLLCTAIDRYHRISKPPHFSTHIAQELLRSCLADSGNTYVLANE